MAAAFASTAATGAPAPAIAAPADRVVPALPATADPASTSAPVPPPGHDRTAVPLPAATGTPPVPEDPARTGDAAPALLADPAATFARWAGVAATTALRLARCWSRFSRSAARPALRSRRACLSREDIPIVAG